MILAFDSYYINEKAHTACIAFEQWTDEAPAQVYTETIPETAEYEPGAFYKRELPCILSLLKQIETAQVSHIVIDGFVVLDDAEKPGLGAHLYASLGQKIPVIGVAKNNFALLQARKRELFRGNSRKPLYITALGVETDLACEYIRSMKGPYRIPDLLKKLDLLSKSL